MQRWYWIKTPKIIKRLFSNQVWDIPNNENKIYLTFDDGPTPEVTQWVLQVLKQQEVKATFFCLGKNIKNHPDIFLKTIQEKHTIGNHTYNHLNGWKTDKEDYLKNVYLCEERIGNHFDTSKLFRPPYGKIKPSQVRKLKKFGFKIMMWDVLSADFEKDINPEKCLSNVINNVTSGSVIVFHDSLKAFDNLKFALPRTIEYLKEKGFKFDIIQ